MALFSQNMLELAMEIAAHDPSYETFADKFVDHLLWIGHAVDHVGTDGLWDEEDGFFYDLLILPDGSATRLKVRSMVGLLPLCATTVIEPWQRERVPRIMELFAERIRRMPELEANIFSGPGSRRSRPDGPGGPCPPAAHPQASCSTRTSSWAPTGSGRFRATTLIIRTYLRPEAGITR